MNRRTWIIPLVVSTLLAVAAGCANPFAPKLDPELGVNSGTLGDQRTVEGVFQNIQLAYAYKDTLIYGNLLHPDFRFEYYNSERATTVRFNRDEEMRITYNIFKSVQQIEMQWNEYLHQDGDSLLMEVSRSYSLKIVYQGSGIDRVDGKASLRLVRESPYDPWLIKIWRDESNS